MVQHRYYLITAGYRKAAARQKVVLHVDDQQRIACLYMDPLGG